MSVKFLSKSKEAFKIFGPLGSFLGFIGDIIKPLAPVLNYLSIAFLGASGILLGLFLYNRKTGTSYPITQYFPHSIILALVFMLFSLMGFGSEKGFFGARFDVIANLQNAMFDLEDESPEAKPAAQPVLAPQVVIVQGDIGQIKELVAMNRLNDAPVDARDILANALIYYNSGNLERAAPMLEKTLKSGFVRYDICLKYMESLYINGSGNADSVKLGISRAGLSGNQVMQLAELAYRYTGVDYYKQLEKLAITDPVLKALAENIKALSLVKEVHNYWLYEPFILGYWMPKWQANDRLLGTGIVRVKDYFFDYTAAYASYLVTTGAADDKSMFWRSDVHNHALSPEVQEHATALWRRVTSGVVTSAKRGAEITITGTVTNAAGEPLQLVVVTDFDTHTMGRTESHMTETDMSGRFTLTTNRGNLIRFENMYGRGAYEYIFLPADDAQEIRVTMKK